MTEHSTLEKLDKAIEDQNKGQKPLRIELFIYGLSEICIYSFVLYSLHYIGRPIHEIIILAFFLMGIFILQTTLAVQKIITAQDPANLILFYEILERLEASRLAQTDPD